MDPGTIYRLYIARQWLQEGVTAARDPLPLGRMRALLVLDDALELALLALLPLDGLGPKREDSIPGHLKQLVAKRPALGTHVGPIERLHRLRDRVKHDGVIPSDEEATIAGNATTSFLADAVQAVTGRALEEITPASLVADKKAREPLLAAEAALRNDDYANAAIEAARAFALGWAGFLARLSIGYRYRVDESENVARELAEELGRVVQAAAIGSKAPEVREFGRAFRRCLRQDQFRRALEPLTRAVTMARFGIDPNELHRFEDLTPTVLVTVGRGRTQVILRHDNPPTREEAASTVDFATRSIIRLEEWLSRNPRHVQPAES